MRNEGLIKGFLAGAAIAAYRIVKFGAGDGLAIQSAAGTDPHIGVANRLGGDEGERFDVVLSGVAEVEYGGAVTRGNALTADANGKAVVAVAGDRIIGQAMVSGVSGDIGSLHIGQAAGANVAGKAYLTLAVPDLTAAEVVRLVSPVGGTISKIWSVIDAALATGNATLTASIGGTPVTNGVVTITQAGSAAGDVDSATPTAANVITAGAAIVLTVGGTNSGTVGATVTLEITL